MASSPSSPTSVAAIARRLKFTRLALGLSQAELCSQAGIARNTYNQWERGLGRPELDKGIALCETFGLTLDWIYRGIIGGLPHGVAVSIRQAERDEGRTGGSKLTAAG